MINYVVGDATEPIGGGMKVIPHICNDVGQWGSGFVMAISRKWPVAREQYMTWFNDREASMELGECQIVKVTNDIHIANLIGQHKIHTTRSTGPSDVKTTGVPIRYWAVRRALRHVAKWADGLTLPISAHMPRIGTERAGGDWAILEDIIDQTIGHLDVTVYDLP